MNPEQLSRRDADRCHCFRQCDRAQRRSFARVVVAIALIPSFAACGDKPPIEQLPPRAVPDIVQSIEMNAARMDRALWAERITVYARWTDADGRTHRHNLEGSLLYRPPRDLWMQLRPAIGDPVLGIGSNDYVYWVWVVPETHELYWGKHCHSGKPCARGAIIRPDELLTAAAISGLPRTGPTLIGPVRQFDGGFDVLEYLRPAPDGPYLVVDRRYSVERGEPYMIRRVQFFDDQGATMLDAALGKYRLAWADGPFVPTEINLIWPARGDKFTLRLETLESRTDVHPSAFTMPAADDLPVDVDRMIQIDAECDNADAHLVP